MDTMKKLYRVNLRGMKTSVTGIAYGRSYVLAEDPTSAYTKVLDFLIREGIGFNVDRELESIELLAKENHFNDTGTMIFI